MDERFRPLARELIDGIVSGEIPTREDVQKRKLALCAEHSLPDVPPNSAILAFADPDELECVGPLLLKKPVRTLSGVAVVAVMTSPHPCPHGKCVYCPGGADQGSPQSYTGKEPAARRAERNGFDPWRQVTDRLRQLKQIGHGTDKVDLIIMGGTFTSRDAGYREWFVRRCFDALNGRDAPDLATAHLWNETSANRCVGLTVETRPDVFGEAEIDDALSLGVTRVELGVQILDDGILASVNRGHGVGEVVQSTEACKRKGLKVCYHIMPGLPGSSPRKDLEAFSKLFDDPRFRPDMLKLYTALVIAGTGLHDMWQAGEYEPYDLGTAIALLSDMKARIPPYVRVQRVQRDIPAPQIAAGITRSNIREVVADEMRSRGTRCGCIRCREAGPAEAPADVPLGDLVYEASGGTEHFISAEAGGLLFGYARLRTDGDLASLRELKVFGRMAGFGDDGNVQHRGLGTRLLERAEAVARESGAVKIRATSGVGVRGYYADRGYSRDGPYMSKALR
ncbi:MAG: tRNA uridine(34) 5-carboxymethylaminomethyl modification radical SAM/GNAT enzyme Elp3 [Thermoplasmatales archaeon]|nr:tRNA uridine(34) 5-carboxymethylaminomethyl modification radical SAM/GNAT enzyme Elp3 [Thermoplasmatales archaeon]